ncbi:hypothetical protein SPRG_02299 [Saprolegnia parasitica CBS 223.65]|uniref:Hook C-terminal domain-containing protein n=1 Tax=Saprolegnia parasitica (strain CBS 223.65) TaxID=695850 RepID=A0A067D416_SAPPC|nr:hypothetical protein SPRG_02299 [Saprolegnia parasitica CBS 223.65]KDO33491.1 hypothetical protein SPRG_02299 [Saprolegnia parasitica CBS 223.65]|eukprot:XP_012196235.1 hypothetical protein SPRG_02299 [Saprolegnia parasitica CBS 223.65]
MDRTTEQLRSKHVRTLELLQKTLDENAEMKKTLSQKAFPLSMGQGVDLSKRVLELENEIERLQRSPAVATDSTTKVATLEARVHELEAANYNLEFNLSATQRLVTDVTRERDELQAAVAANVAKADARSNQDADTIAKALDAHAHAEGECLRMADTIEKLTKREGTFLEQIEALRAQKLAFENEHAALYRTLEEKERQMDRVVQELHEARAEINQLRESPKVDQTQSIKVEVTPAISQEALDSAMRPTLARNKQLLRDNQQLRDHVESLQAELAQYQSRLSSTTTFAAHIDLKKENYLLRQQVEEMQALQKKFLGTAKKQTFQFNNQRGV